MGDGSVSLQQVLAALRGVKGDLPATLGLEDSLVLKLGFDSMNMALLSLALENQLGCPIALDGWISSHPDPHQLTVGSLAHYVAAVSAR
jgi:acyl carrier protein